DLEKTKKLHAELDKAADERLNQARQNLQAYFEARKIFVRWGVTNKQTRITAGGAAFGRATLRFEFPWAEATGGNQKYFKSAVAEFELIGQDWRLDQVVWITKAPERLDVPMKTLVQDLEILKLLAAEKGLGHWLKEGAAKAKAGKWEDAITDLNR